MRGGALPRHASLPTGQWTGYLVLMDTMILAERLKTAANLQIAAQCCAALEQALPTCETKAERQRLLTGIAYFKADAKRHGDRLLQLAISDIARVI